MEEPKIVNCVFNNALPKPVQLSERLCSLSSGETLKLYKGRPTMLSVRKSGATLNLFASGRFRVMGSYYTNPDDARQWVVQLLGESAHVPQHLYVQTVTVKFHVKPVSSCFVSNHANMISYDFELFPSIKLLHWPDVHVNLFFSGAVIVLGRHATLRATEVRQWLSMAQSAEEAPPILTMNVHPQTCDERDASERLILSHLPEVYHKAVRPFLNTYPNRLILSWAKRINTSEREEVIGQLMRYIRRV